MNDDPRALLRTYLQDHHAGSTAGLELARRTAAANEGSRFGTELGAVAAEIAEDREQLERIMDELGVGAHAIKEGAMWTAEKLGRFKPNNRLRGYSPLSRVIELEGLLLGVTGKLALWEALSDAVGETIAGVDFAALAERARGQRTRLEALRREAARSAFTAAA